MLFAVGALDREAPTPRSRGEYRTVIGEQRRREPWAVTAPRKLATISVALNTARASGSRSAAASVVEHVQDLDPELVRVPALPGRGDPRV